jgi:hypothetical protein
MSTADILVQVTLVLPLLGLFMIPSRTRRRA